MANNGITTRRFFIEFDLQEKIVSETGPGTDKQQWRDENKFYSMRGNILVALPNYIQSFFVGFNDNRLSKYY